MTFEELECKNISNNTIKRINTLYKNIYGCDPLSDIDIRYQLLTGVSGTLLEAKELHIPKALFFYYYIKKR